MRDDRIFRATFSDFLISAFGKVQQMKWTGEVEMYQARDSPALWRARPYIGQGTDSFHASSPVELAKVLEQHFVQRTTRWTEHVPHRLSLFHRAPKTAVPIELNRRAGGSR